MTIFCNRNVRNLSDRAKIAALEKRLSSKGPASINNLAAATVLSLVEAVWCVAALELFYPYYNKGIYRHREMLSFVLIEIIY